MKTLESSECCLRGEWITGAGGVRPDDVALRVEWLVENVLVKIADSPDWGAWLTLYRDPVDGRLWETSYPEGERQGGGPPQLAVISDAEARRKFQLPDGPLG